MTAGLAALISVLLLTWPATAGSVQQSEQAPPPAVAKGDPAETVRQALIFHGSEQPARVNAAIELLGTNLEFLVAQLSTSASDDVVRAILDAVQIRVAQHERSVELVPAILSLTLAEGRGDLPERALATLRSIDGVWSSKTRPQIEVALQSGDGQRALAAVRVLAMTRDLAVVAPLLDLLERTQGKGRLASACSKALTEILGATFGTDIQAWREFWSSCAGKSRDRILEEALDRVRQENLVLIEAKNREIVRLKREKDANDPQALVANLSDELPGVRKFAAELLVRGPSEWDLQPARPTVIARLKAGTDPQDVLVGFLQLLKVIDLQSGRTGLEPERDGLIVACLGSSEPEKVIAAVDVAEHFPVAQVRSEVLRILSMLKEQPLSIEARVALVEACAEGKLSLRAARDPLLALLHNDTAMRVRRAAVFTLGSLKIADTEQDLARVLLEDADWQVRRGAASALRKVTEKPAMGPLIKALDDAKPEVRSEVVTVLASLPRPQLGTDLTDAGSATVVSALSDRLGREEAVNVRAALVRALGQLGSAAALPVLCEAALEVPPVNGSAPDPAVGVLVESVRGAITQLAGDNPADWTEVVTRFDGRQELLFFSLPHQLRTMQAAGAPASSVLSVRVRLASAALAVGAFDHPVLQVVAEDAAAPVPANGADQGLLSELAVLQGRALSRQGDGPGAAAQFDRALALGGLGDTRVQVLCLAADAYLSAGESKRALELLASEPKLPPHQLLVLARLERAAQRWPEAIGHYRAWVAAPGSATPVEQFTARLELVEALLKTKDAAGAQASLPDPAQLPAESDPALAARLKALGSQVQAALLPPPPVQAKPEEKVGGPPGPEPEKPPAAGGGGFARPGSSRASHSLSAAGRGR